MHDNKEILWETCIQKHIYCIYNKEEFIDHVIPSLSALTSIISSDDDIFLLFEPKRYITECNNCKVRLFAFH